MNWQKIFGFFGEDLYTLVYSGEFNDKTLAPITNIIANHYGDDYKLKVKNIFIAIELFQNIIKYAYKDTSLNVQFFQTRRLNNGNFLISSSNIIPSKMVEDIKAKIDKINSLDVKELKKHYREVLLNGQYSDKGGAGLGLIEMRRKTSQYIDYKFVKINDSQSVFLIAVKYFIDKEGQQQEKEFDIEKIWQIYKELSNDGQLLLALKHNFSEDLNKHIFYLLQNAIKEEDLYNRKKLFSVNVEIIQNLSKYAEKRTNNECYYFLYRTPDNAYKVFIGNYILKDNVDFLKNFLKLLKNSNKSLLDELYRDGLREGDLESAGLGYIDLVRMSKKFDYNFFNFSEEFSFFVLHLQI